MHTACNAVGSTVKLRITCIGLGNGEAHFSLYTTLGMDIALAYWSDESFSPLFIGQHQVRIVLRNRFIVDSTG
ncbi:MAG: hypothetical protein JWP57_724 [Spirosoma sp.]|nr:hypothetical protein [Spirosoma sp.]